MNFSRILIPIGVVVFIAGAWLQYQWQGVAVATGAVVMWILLHFTRMVTVLSRAANRPVGHVGNAVMLNVKLQKGVNLMHVIALTKSLGERLSEENTQPEIFKWTDAGDSYVVCTFSAGKLVSWEMTRPAEESSDTAAPTTDSTHAAS
jgi:cytochrome c biogenesis protein CcdA